MFTRKKILGPSGISSFVTASDKLKNRLREHNDKRRDRRMVLFQTSKVLLTALLKALNTCFSLLQVYFNIFLVEHVLDAGSEETAHKRMP